MWISIWNLYSAILIFFILLNLTVTSSMTYDDMYYLTEAIEGEFLEADEMPFNDIQTYEDFWVVSPHFVNHCNSAIDLNFDE